MANCAKCGTNVGCGCHLNKEGLCASCAQKKRQEILPKPPTIPPKK